MEKLKVGQRIELVKILDDASYGDWVFKHGTVRPAEPFAREQVSGLYIVLDEDGDCTIMPGESVRSVGAMIVKKLKQPYRKAELGKNNYKVRN